MVPFLYLRTFCSYEFFYYVVSIEIDFGSAGVIQGFALNFSLYLLTFFNGACASKLEFILFKEESIERLTFC